MRSAVLALLLLLAAGCGGTANRGDTSKADGAPLRTLCPGVHLAVDSLVVSDPASRTVFADQVARLRAAGTKDSQQTLEPLIQAAQELLAVKTDQQFFVARDDVHAAVVKVDTGCVAVGSPILHSGPHQSG